MGYGTYTYPYTQPAYVYNTNSTQTASASSSITPPPNGFPISINGRTYMIDTSFEPYRREAFRHKSIPPQRQSLHFTNIPDDGTVSTEGLWRREARDWSLGSGQTYFDRNKSANERFFHSKGINPWTQWQLTLHNDVTKQYTGTVGSVKSIHVGKYIYIADGINTASSTVAYRTTWSSSPTTLTGMASGTTVLDLCTDGYYVYILTTNGVYQYAAGTSSSPTRFVKSTNSSGTDAAWTANISGVPLTGIIAYTGGRLIMALNNVASWGTGASVGANVWDLSSSTSHVSGTALATGTPEHLMTHPTLTWRWTAIASGSANVYLAGYAWDGTVADRGSIYRATINATAGNLTSNNTELNYPVQALPMTLGEYPTAMHGYLNYIFIGTNKGIRMCQPLNQYDPSGNAGDLKAGPLIPDITEVPSQPVTAIVGDDRYIYWAWNNYDTLSTGLGRLDLTTFIDALAPAYASDLMITGQGSGQGACTWLDWDPNTNTPLMSMNGLTNAGTTGNYIYTGNPNSCVTSGTIDSGFITYGIPDNKNVVRVETNVENNNGSSVSFGLAVDNQVTINLGTYSNNLQQGVFDFIQLGLGQQFGEQYRLYTTLNAGTQGGNNVSPILNRWTLKGLPGIPSGIQIMAVILLYEPLEMEGQIIYQDPYAEYAYLENLRQKQLVVPYVEGPFTANVTVDMIDWLPERRRDVRQGGYHGDMVVTLKTVTG